MVKKLHDEYGERIFGEGETSDLPLVVADKPPYNWQDRRSVITRTTGLVYRAPNKYALNPADNRPRFPVNISYARGPQLLNRGPSMAVAPITGSIVKVEIWWNGALVTSVPAGDHFDVKVFFDCSNPGGGNWTIGATVVRTDGSDSHFDLYKAINTSHQIDGFLIQDAQSANSPFTMPAAAVNYRVTLWAYPFAPVIGNLDPQEFLSKVPRSQW